jgi:undecaprenyl-diphosphatase
MPILIVIILGIVEGLTEFLPVSSTGHLILVGDLLGFEGEKAKSFEIFIQLGAILAVAIMYRKRLWDMAFRWNPRDPAGRMTVWHLAVAMVPAVVLGLAAYHPIKVYLFGPAAVLVGLVAGGVFMLAAERLAPAPRVASLDAVTYAQALGIGLFQCLALWPGFSRSGATIAGALVLGLALRPAAEFSFLLAVPMMVAATGLDMAKSWRMISPQDAVLFLLGFAVAFLAAWAAVAAFIRFLERVRLAPFAWYRFAAAGLFGIYFFGMK